MPASLPVQASLTTGLLSLTAAQLDDLGRDRLGKAVREAGKVMDQRVRREGERDEEHAEEVKRHCRKRLLEARGRAERGILGEEAGS
jgi:hypothetical protein